jgi:UDP-N-acetylglucosamine transferase subunit ALG13
MITVTLGTIPYPFDRTVNWINFLIKKEVIVEPVFFQHGFTKPKDLCDYELVTCVPLLPGKELAKKIEASRFVIAHAGQGSTRKLAVQDKSFVIVPRLPEYGEHIDNHQLLFAKGVENLGVKVCLTLEDLEMAICQPPLPLSKDLFASPKLGDFLAEKYPRHNIRKVVDHYATRRS